MIFAKGIHHLYCGTIPGNCFGCLTSDLHATFPFPFTCPGSSRTHCVTQSGLEFEYFFFYSQSIQEYRGLYHQFDPKDWLRNSMRDKEER